MDATSISEMAKNCQYLKLHGRTFAGTVTPTVNNTILDHTLHCRKSPNCKSDPTQPAAGQLAAAGTLVRADTLLPP